MFNCDETGLPLNPSSFKVVALKGSNNVSNITSNSKSQITVLACTSAAGYAIPPFIVFGCNTYHPHLSRCEVPGTMYGMTPKGWMTQNLFFEWFKKHFLRYIPSIRPVLLLLDGHSSHYCPEFVKLAAKEKVIVFVLPPTQAIGNKLAINKDFRPKNLCKKSGLAYIPLSQLSHSSQEAFDEGQFICNK